MDDSEPDPTRLAISLLPLLTSANLTLPDLAAGLSVLPANVAQAIEALGVEVKARREEAVLFGGGKVRPGSDGAGKEGRQRWLEKEKMEHLEGSVSSLSSLHSSLQARHLATLDALSNLQASVEPSLEEMRNERDALRAVNGVLKGRVKVLEAEVAEERKIMARVVEEVKEINDFGILEHAVAEVYEPIPSSSRVNGVHADLSQDDDASSQYTERNHHNHSETSYDGSYSRDLDSTVPSSPRPVSPRADLFARQTKLAPAPDPLRADRSLSLVADLTEELELVRHEARKELRAREREVVCLEAAVEERGREVRRAMEVVEEVLSLRGYVVRTATDKLTAAKSKPSSSRKASRLEAEVEELEAQLQLLESRRGNESADLHITDGGGSVISLDSNDRLALSRALTDLSTQIVELKRALREVTNERDNLRGMRRQSSSSPAPSTSRSEAEPLNDRLREAELERDRLATLLRAAEAEIYTLQRRSDEQEAEFEQVAERVRLKLEEYREKLDQARMEISTLHATLDATEREAEETAHELEAERRQRKVLSSMSQSQLRPASSVGRRSESAGLGSGEERKRRTTADLV